MCIRALSAGEIQGDMNEFPTAYTGSPGADRYTLRIDPTNSGNVQVIEALAKVPGVTLVSDMADGAGRHGLAVTRPTPSSMRDPRYTGPPLNESLVFDRNTYEFLGDLDLALLRMAIVDRIGQVP